MLKFYVSLQNMLERLSRDEEGQTAVEYGLVTALIAAVVVVALKVGVDAVISDVVTKLQAAI